MGRRESRRAEEIDKLLLEANDAKVKARGRRAALWVAAACGLLLVAGTLIYSGRSFLGMRGATDSNVVRRAHQPGFRRASTTILSLTKQRRLLLLLHPLNRVRNPQMRTPPLPRWLKHQLGSK